MGTPLRALLVEDVEQDSVLVVRELRRGGFDVTYERVETPEAMTEALTRPWDVVLSDYSMPRFSGPMALRLVRAAQIDVPFIIISGTVNDDIAVEALHAGAQDFMAKGNLRRLVPAVERELRNVVLRSEQKKMEDQLLLSDRMASMGTLAAGVAHEINNPLACAMANVDLAACDLVERAATFGVSDEFNEVREALHDARHAIERIRSIVRDLKIFSRAREERNAPVDVAKVMDSTIRMAWNEVRHRARLVKRYSPTPPVEASESRLGQVFLNIVINAAQAIPEGHAENNEILISISATGDDRVVIEISDTGPGMPKEVLDRLFTPFFTTKPIGVGTGLGLSICHRIVSDLGGGIDVKSVVGQGATFRISLPAAHDAVAVEGPPVALDGPARRRGRILVIDDEPMIGRAVQRTLSAEHDVVAITTGTDALARIGAGDRFDVILCDLMMPQMTGMELHAELRKLDHAHADCMVFLTGGAFTSDARTFLDEVAARTVEKPFEARMLRALVNDRIK